MSLAHETSLTALAANRRAFGKLPELADAPSVFRTVARIIARNWTIGTITFVMPSRRELRIVGEAPGLDARLIVNDFRFIRRALAGGDIGFAEGFMAGEWDTPDLSALLQAFTANWDRMERLMMGNRAMQVLNRLTHALRSNSRRGARKNIHAHYDLGNAFYASWLDPSMTYSSALYSRPGEPLAEAQANKYRSLAKGMGLQSGHHILEIGCGWGGFAEFAAKEVGARVTGITISQEQYDFAKKRMFEQGLAERADIQLIDYRDVEGAYDRVASIEMFEAVGERYWPTYFASVHDRLKPGGVAGLQIITIRDEYFEEYRRRPDFIQKYIFPGGMLPSPAKLREETERAGLAPTGLVSFGQHYADTLAEWTRSFDTAWRDIQKLGFDDRFRRLWRFYLGYCEAGFRCERTDVIQLNLARA